MTGVFYCCHAAIPHLRKQGKRGGGYIINISSLAGKNAFNEGTAYNASKFGLEGFSEALMLDLRHEDIKVSYIMPGSVATEFAGREPSARDSWKLTAGDVASSRNGSTCPRKAFPPEPCRAQTLPTAPEEVNLE